MDCFCLLFVTGSRWFNNAGRKKGAVNLGAMHFTSLHALIKALTSVGHTKEGSYLHTHVKKENMHMLTHTHRHTHTSMHARWSIHTFDSIIIEPTSHESGSHEHRAYTSFDVSLGSSISSNAALFRKGNFRLAKSYHENNLASVNGYYWYAKDSGCDTISASYPNLPPMLVLLYSF